MANQGEIRKRIQMKIPGKRLTKSRDQNHQPDLTAMA